MALTYQAEGWQEQQMNMREPHKELEPLEREIAAIDCGLSFLLKAGVLEGKNYDKEKMLLHRAAVRDNFDIPWTAITPRMQRLLYALNAIAKPQVMIAVGIFCGNTYISNAGAAIGPGACYKAQRLVGIEIKPAEADRARRNVAKIAADDSPFEILAEDGIPWLERFEGTIDLLYLDADGHKGQGKAIYLELLQAAEHALRPGSLILAHNSVNAADNLAEYLEYVRDPKRFTESVNMVVDDQGLEVSRHK